MEEIVKIQGYHTCKMESGLNYVKCHAPFLSQANNRQWLTQGYYFWTDSDHFAHEWGRKAVQGRYAIVHCAIELNRKRLLDLVGSVQDQLYFQEILSTYSEWLKKIDPTKKPTVHAVLSHYRKLAKGNPAVFPYSAVKAQDGYSKSNVAFSDGKKEHLPLVTRHQLCLFEFAADCIKQKRVIYPEK